MSAESIAILGAGSWGTALALTAARNGHRVVLWGHNAQHMADMAASCCNSRYLPDTPLPESLTLTADLASAVAGADFLLLAVPSHAFRATLERLHAFHTAGTTIAWATKGLDPDSGGLLQQTVAEVFSPDTAMALLSGPTFAREVAQGLPTAITLAANQPVFAERLARIFHSPTFRVYTSSDLIGAQLGGAVKNVLAIAAGISDGLGYGANTRAALVTRGLAEMMRLGQALGAHSETLMGLAGLGDLVLTCTDNQSRNRRMGLALGQNQTQAEALAGIGQEVEGVAAAREVYRLAQCHGVEMPITEQVYHVLHEGLAPEAAVYNLLNREPKAE
ncbi:MAG: NAD(P)-dependent glycerol-3-phosphate dehydrogenase [Methylococcaceae bacterium]|nr:MAG: NAD(P)-dependent glycerol-3-phosphate dehydrogenase [Methylococcaceae bacterium]